MSFCTLVEKQHEKMHTKNKVVFTAKKTMWSLYVHYLLTAVTYVITFSGFCVRVCCNKNLIFQAIKNDFLTALFFVFLQHTAVKTT